MKIAVIAHDGKKAEMVAFLNRHMDFLKSVGTEIGSYRNYRETCTGCRFGS